MIITDIDQINQRLSGFNGGSARIWLFDISLTRLLLRIERKGLDTVLGLLAAGCSRISGPFSWNVSSLEVVQDTGAARIQDLGVPFILECATYVLIERSEIPMLSSLEELADERIAHET